jgi:group I intron endonuclease
MVATTLVLPYPISGPGVYRIVDRVSRRFYIGSSVDIARRWTQHTGRLAAGTHPNPALQAIWNSEPSSRLHIETLIVTAPTREALLSAEQCLLDQAGAGRERACLNVLAVAGSHLGRKRSAETVARMAAAQVGKTASAQAKAKMRAAKLGKAQTAEHRAKSAAARRGKRGTPRAGIPKPTLRRLSDEQVAALRAAREEGASWLELGRGFGLCASAAKRAALGISYARPAA